MDSEIAPAIDRAILQPANAQQRSPFFALFPPEIRVMIYHQYFGQKTIHLIENTPEKFPSGLPQPRPNHSSESLLSYLSFSRTRPEPAWVHFSCQHLGRGLRTEPWGDFSLRFCYYECVFRGKFDDPNRVDISIMKVCKRLYHEAWPVLHSKLLVHVIDRTLSYQGFLWDGPYPPPMRFVQNVALSWYLTQDRHVFRRRPDRGHNQYSAYNELYRDFWATVAALPELRYLRVDVYVREMGRMSRRREDGDLPWAEARKRKGQRYVAENVEPWLEAMGLVKHVSRIDVRIGDLGSKGFDAAISFEKRKHEFGLNNSNFKDMPDPL